MSCDIAAVSAFAGNVSDLGGNWAKNQISKWMDQGLIAGYPDGEFKPNNPVTRAELTVLINRAFGFTETKKLILAISPTVNGIIQVFCRLMLRAMFRATRMGPLSLIRRSTVRSWL